MNTLHILSHSPFTDNRFSSALGLLGAEDGLLLTGDALYALQQGSEPYQALLQLDSKIALYALDEDLKARALTPRPRVQLVDYAGFVELCSRYARSNSWL